MALNCRLEALPNEILDVVLQFTRVNDQICLAMTSKNFFHRVNFNNHLACNSLNPDIRYEAWRFTWMVSPTSHCNSLCHCINLDDQGRIKEHLRRCKRSSKRDLRARLLGGTGRNSPAPVVYVTRSGVRKSSTRKAAIEAAARICKIYAEQTKWR